MDASVATRPKLLALSLVAAIAPAAPLRRWRPGVLALQLLGMAILLQWLRQVKQNVFGGAIRGPFPLPLVGTLHRFLLKISRMHETSAEDFEEFGSFFSWFYFHKPMVGTNCPFHLRRVLVSKWRRYDRGAEEEAAFGELLGAGLIMVPNAAWGDMRRLYQPAFSDRNILEFAACLRPWAEKFAQGLLVAGEGGRAPLDIQEATQRLTFRAIGLFTLGVDFEDETWLGMLREEMRGTAWPCSNFGQLWAKLLVHVHRRFFWGPVKWWKVLRTREVRAFERAHALLLRVIDTAIEARESGAGRPARFKAPRVFQDLLTLMLSSKGRRFSRTELQHQALTFLFAGHDTTTTLIALCLHLLAKHTAYQKRAKAEAAEPDGPKPFLRACLLETLRLYPSVPLRSRTLAAEDEFTVAEPGRCPMLRDPSAPVKLPKGTGVQFSIYAMHRDPSLWVEPGTFDPSRFEAHTEQGVGSLPVSPLATQDTEALSYLPFGAGPRRCIGERLALVEAEEICAAILRQCEVKLAQGEPKLQAEMHLTLCARGGVPLVFRPAASSPPAKEGPG